MIDDSADRRRCARILGGAHLDGKAGCVPGTSRPRCARSIRRCRQRSFARAAHRSSCRRPSASFVREPPSSASMGLRPACTTAAVAPSDTDPGNRHDQHAPIACHCLFVGLVVELVVLHAEGRQLDAIGRGAQTPLVASFAQCVPTNPNAAIAGNDGERGLGGIVVARSAERVDLLAACRLVSVDPWLDEGRRSTAARRSSKWDGYRCGDGRGRCGRFRLCRSGRLSRKTLSASSVGTAWVLSRSTTKRTKTAATTRTVTTTRPRQASGGQFEGGKPTPLGA